MLLSVRLESLYMKSPIVHFDDRLVEMKHDEDHDNLNTTVKIPVCYKLLSSFNV